MDKPNVLAKVSFSLCVCDYLGQIQSVSPLNFKRTAQIRIHNSQQWGERHVNNTYNPNSLPRYLVKGQKNSSSHLTFVTDTYIHKLFICPKLNGEVWMDFLINLNRLKCLLKKKKQSLCVCLPVCVLCVCVYTNYYITITLKSSDKN